MSASAWSLTRPARPALTATRAAPSTMFLTRAPLRPRCAAQPRVRLLHAAARQPLRILALPLARSPKDPQGSTPLIYWHVSQRYARDRDSTTAAAEGEAPPLNWREPATWVPFAIEKASSTWLAWGEKPEQGREGWADKVKGAKYWVWRRGEGLMDRIEADEAAERSRLHRARKCEITSGEGGRPTPPVRRESLDKAVSASPRTPEAAADASERPPLLRPTSIHDAYPRAFANHWPRFASLRWALKSINAALPAIPRNADESTYRIPLIYPSSHPSIPDASVLATELRAHLASRIPHHKRLLIRSLILLPFTIPIAALPIIPNLPGFYVAFRAYSHWKALQGARWLSAAVGEENDGRETVEVVPSDALAGCLVVPTSQGSSSPTTVEQSSNTAPDTTATPASYPTRTPLAVEFSGDTMAEKTMEMTNLTHGGGETQTQKKKAEDEDDGVKHDSRDVSHDTTSTPASRVHPSQNQQQRDPTSSEQSDAATISAQHKVTSATPLFVPSTASASTNSDGEKTTTTQDQAVDSKIYLPTAAIPRLVKAFDLAPHEVVDVTRAVMQARIRWVKALKNEGSGQGRVADKTA
ncbi:hypothetical protein QFC19_000085 [Naganishia cerealis]|uniref:Uncharacterized protein n=1 Tax=Naganishia cerealis TaxID=610337 RepID=A0ACC2WSU6_9TREE|nr:hypothetical protein QFC19_000085 [Naganishia cerealis]